MRHVLHIVQLGAEVEARHLAQAPAVVPHHQRALHAHGRQ